MTSPLVESLKHKTIVEKSLPAHISKGGEAETLYDIVESAVFEYEELKYRTPYAFVSRKNIDGQVTSVQRVLLPEGVTGDEAAHLYIDWLSTLPFINTLRGAEGAVFKLPFLKPILVLKYSKERSTKDRALYYVSGGMLAKVHEKGRFEFRQTFDNRYLITALHNFRPRLPWYIYSITQAPIHLLVMWLFGKYMKQKYKS